MELLFTRLFKHFSCGAGAIIDTSLCTYVDLSFPSLLQDMNI